MNIRKLENAYKYKFVPLIITGIILIIALLLKYVFQIEVGKFFGWSIFLFFAAFIYYRALLEQKKKNEKAQELANNPPPPLTFKEMQKAYEDEMEANSKVQVNNIIFRSVYLFFGVSLTLIGVSLLIEQISGFGIIIFVTGALFSIHSIFLLKKWIALWKFFKQEKKKKVFDE